MTLSADDLALLVSLGKKQQEQLTADQRAGNEAKMAELMTDPEKMKEAGEGQKALFDTADANKNGVLTLEEFQAMAKL